ncbi:hypothetical protein C2G38_2198382 [Gigaspora rosea]|uniref:(d)CMP kinase n=1 Tax=Gigaspora rosea TaxID=44941 RepID=A0A397USN0_9GLOM|nr:hypothetical protein C2G38_2198382 [Gigaspora rosea]
MINIAIDGPTVSDKTTVGKLIAENLNYQFINIEVFYCYLEYKYSIYNNTLIDDFKNFKNKNILNKINTIIKNLSKENYFYSEQQAAELSKNVELFGRDATFNLLPNAEIKIFLLADINIRALRRARQLKLNDITNDIWLDILNQDSKSFDLIEEAKKVFKIINTINLTLANVVDLVLTQVFYQIFNIKYNKYLPTKRKNIFFNEIISDKKLINEDEKTIPKQVKPKTSDEEIEYYINMKNWKLSDEVDNYALELAFPNEEARLIFQKLEKDSQKFGSNSQEICSQELKSNLQNFKQQKNDDDVLPTKKEALKSFFDQ